MGDWALSGLTWIPHWEISWDTFWCMSQQLSDCLSWSVDPRVFLAAVRIQTGHTRLWVGLSWELSDVIHALALDYISPLLEVRKVWVMDSLPKVILCVILVFSVERIQGESQSSQYQYIMPSAVLLMSIIFHVSFALNVAETMSCYFVIFHVDKKILII